LDEFIGELAGEISMAARELVAASIWRGGLTASHKSLETRHVDIEADRRLTVSFCISSKGGGTTEIDLHIGSRDFATIISAMVEADRQSAMEAMSNELARQIGEQPSHDAALMAKGRHSLRRQAQRELHSLSNESKAAARFTLETVEALLERLEAQEKAADNRATPKQAP
jgi:hypothetical protein